MNEIKLYDMTDEMDKIEKHVNMFAKGMKTRAFGKVFEGWTGWDSPSCMGVLKDRLRDHVWKLIGPLGEISPQEAAALARHENKHEEIDVAVLAMFLYFLRMRRAGNFCEKDDD